MANMSPAHYEVHRVKEYQLHAHLFLKHLPTAIVPYAELMRIHRPVGILNIFLPYLFGVLFIACTHRNSVPGWSLLEQIFNVFVFAFLLRSAGCTWNDIADRDLDRFVQRSRSRPMARKAISVRAAYVFTIAQVGLCFALLSYLLPGRWMIYGLPLSLLVWSYPFAKRVTDYTQMVLGITLGWGVLIGGAMIGVDTLELGLRDSQAQGLASLYALYATWTVIHDTVYAHQDMNDDLKVGIGSMAGRWRRWTKTLLLILSSVQIALLLDVGSRMDAGMTYYCTAVGGNSLVLGCMVLRLDQGDPENCLWWFQWASLAVGFSAAAGLWGQYIIRLEL